MPRAPVQPRDPLVWCAIIALAFALAVGLNLAIPHKFFFDEIHYIPAARHMLALDQYTNKEHPLFGKEMLALGLAVFGDNSFGWRAMPLVAGTVTVFAAMRALWFASLSRFATLAYGFLLVTGFFVWIHARIAMLDGFLIASLAVAYWQLAAAMREPETGRWRLALAGLALGCALATKWNAIPLAVLPGLAFLVLRFFAGRRRLLTSRRGLPVPGVTLVEAAVWLGVVPVAVYFASFAPAFFFAQYGLEGGPWSLVAFQQTMLDLQQSVKRPHPYMSTWERWVIDWRPIWYLYEKVDGAQRGILMIGNPVSMLLGLPALLWCAYAGFWQRRGAEAGAFIIYAVSLGFWIVAAKPVQFYYHYFAPSMALLAALALALDALWRTGWRKTALVPLAATLAVFAYFFPIVNAMPLAGERSFEDYTWLKSWR